MEKMALIQLSTGFKCLKTNNRIGLCLHKVMDLKMIKVHGFKSILFPLLWIQEQLFQLYQARF